jgi:glycosyltransferase involved in cell wall biosynthesis
MTAETTGVRRPLPAPASAPKAGRLRVLHLVLVLGETNSQYNEHCLPQVDVRDLAVCTYFTPRLTPAPAISLFAGDGTLAGFFRALRSALNGGEYDVIHAHSPHTAALLPLMLLSRPTYWRLWSSTVLTVHDSFYDYKPRNQVLTVAGLAAFRRVVFCSHAAFDSLPPALKRLVGARARVVQNAADLARVARAVGVPASGDDVFRVVSVGRLEQVKDPLALLAAFVGGGDADCRLQLIGAGSLTQDLARAVGARALQDRVELSGLVARDEVFVAYGSSDLFVSVSHGEGLPVAVMEAMAAGLPVVLSDIPPHRELVDGLEGVPLVRPGDVDGFAREISRFRLMPSAERRDIGRRCRDLVVERFTLERMHAGYDLVYRELATREGTR